MDVSKLSVVVPVYNNRATLPQIPEAIRAVPIPKEIVIVDDGSRDGTRDFLRRLEGDVAEPGRADAKNDIRVFKGLPIRSDRFGIEPDGVVALRTILGLALVNHLGEAGRRRRGPGPRP